jgi:hypothetical protein
MYDFVYVEYLLLTKIKIFVIDKDKDNNYITNENMLLADIVLATNVQLTMLLYLYYMLTLSLFISKYMVL